MNKIVVLVLEYIMIYSASSNYEIEEKIISINEEHEYQNHAMFENRIQNGSKKCTLPSISVFFKDGFYGLKQAMISNMQQTSFDATEEQLLNVFSYEKMSQTTNSTNNLSSHKKRKDNFDESKVENAKKIRTQELQSQYMNEFNLDEQMPTTSKILLQNDSEIQEDEIFTKQSNIINNVRSNGQKFSRMSRRDFMSFTNKLIKEQTSNILASIDDFANDLCNIFNADFLTVMQDQSFDNIITSANFQNLMQVLEKASKKDEILLEQEYIRYYTRNEYFYEEKFDALDFCVICQLDKKITEKLSWNLYDEIIMFNKIIPMRFKSCSRLIIVELKRFFNSLDAAESYQLLFSKRFIELNNNMSKLKFDPEIHNFARQSRIVLKYELLHLHIHFFLNNHIKEKIKLFPEFISIAYLLHKKDVLEKIASNNFFIVFYYSIISINLFFDKISTNNEIETLIQNTDKRNNQIILQSISFLLRIYYILPMIICFNLEVDTLLRYSYLIRKEFTNQIKSAANMYNNVNHHQYVLDCIIFVLCLDTNVSSLIFLKVFRDVKIWNNRYESLWFHANDLCQFRTFLESFKKKHQI